MTLAPGRFDYAPITERPIIKWPDNARVAFWVAPNMEFFEYMPDSGRRSRIFRTTRRWITAIAWASGGCWTC